ncbi:hypothetical protein H696_02245 [Fonticula alba]|uniref:Uncharacterized protein n=1 Tax=Fonticula alba TaxID=691883 RepID=A0A058ZAD1_FONAL|nr:hypothetical protein H696_02245 [Fonticula alba]KCV71299.1 hypothetical protein H696_02245 [Fonticula alba]|eukprot:XP_009494422.1 hypothetical protein H696_02245 [Fonticula alba]
MAVNLGLILPFVVLLCVQIFMVLFNVTAGLVPENRLAYLGLIDLLFPILALFAATRHKSGRSWPASIMLVYIFWCFIWTVMGILVILVRTKVLVYSADNSFLVALLGSPDAVVPRVTEIVTYVCLGIQAIGFFFGIVVRLRIIADDGYKGTSSSKFL